jgi:hypothetical protein
MSSMRIATGRAVATVVTAGVAVTVLAGCGGGPEVGKAGTCADPVAVDGKQLTTLPIDLSRAGTVTKVTSGNGKVGATAVSEAAVDDVYKNLRGMLGSAGFRVTAGETEGFEAEIYYARGKDRAGSFKLVQGPCEGQTTIKLSGASGGAG